MKLPTWAAWLILPFFLIAVEISLLFKRRKSNSNIHDEVPTVPTDYLATYKLQERKNLLES